MEESNSKTYKGLSNIGATCYMNSLLQTLFMTPQFRKMIYDWQYDPKIHPKQSDSIIYQLQKLFGKLQLNFPAQVSTRELAKSFQWMDGQVLQQQDIQQFNRVLFEALEKSFENNNKNLLNHSQPFINGNYQKQQFCSLKNYYDGSFLNYTKCDVCGYQYAREEVFQDVILTIKNQYEKVYNNSTELALQRYIKPSKLDNDNLYNCQQCNTKVVAEKGVRFLKMPKLLSIVLQRFNFDYFTFERSKINDYHEFPFVMNFNNYMHGYQAIPNKLDQDTSAYFAKANIPKKTTNTNGVSYGTKKMAKKTSKAPSVAGKLKTKPLAQTKTFLKDIRAKKAMFGQEQTVNEDLLYVSGSRSQYSQPQIPLDFGLKKEQANGTNPQRKLSKSDEIDIGHFNGSQSCEGHLSGNIDLQEQTSQIQIQQDFVKEEHDLSTKESERLKMKPETQKKGSGNSLPPPPPSIILAPPLPISKAFNAGNTKQTERAETKVKTAQEQLQQILQKREILKEQKAQRLNELNQKNRQKIQEYLKDGPLVYQLYAVMIHSGGATHGHYHSYIKSFQDGRWYCFNDERVSQVNVAEINKAYGGNGTTANAYALNYRQVEEEDPHWKIIHEDVSINNNNGNSAKNHLIKMPDYIANTLEEQMSLLKVRQKQKLLNLENTIILKVSYQLYVKQLLIDKSAPLKLCELKAMELFNIEPNSIKKCNYRLRAFNPVSETKLETYTGKEQQSLESLGIGAYKNLLFQVKKDQQVFQEFTAGCITLRLVLWEEVQGTQIQSLEQQYLKLHKVAIHRFSNMKQLEKDISRRRNQILQLQSINSAQNQQISIVKRHQNDQYSYHQVVNSPDYHTKNLDQVMINENQILYIEPYSQNLNWPREFQNEIYRINVKYNLPNGDKNQVFNIMTDSRITLQELKQQICQALHESPDDIIIKRGNKSGLQLKNTALTLKQHRFINGTQLHLQKGMAAQQGQTRIQLYFAKDAPPQVINRLHEFQFIADVPVNGASKASQVKELFIKVVHKLKGIELEKDKFRIRELVSDKIGKIYRERPMKQQQLIQKRQIAIEMVEDKVKDPKDLSIYVREWNAQTWQLSPKYEFIVNKNTSMLDLVDLLHEVGVMKDCNAEKMLICRVLSIHKFSMLDLVQLQYFPMENLPVIGEPMFVNADGLLFIVKDLQKQPRDLTKQEQKKFGGTVNVRVNPRIRARQAPNKKEKAMTIKVVQRQLEQPKIQTTEQNTSKDAKE